MDTLHHGGKRPDTKGTGRFFRVQQRLRTEYQLVSRLTSRKTVLGVRDLSDDPVVDDSGNGREQLADARWYTIQVIVGNAYLLLEHSAHRFLHARLPPSWRTTRLPSGRAPLRPARRR